MRRERSRNALAISSTSPALPSITAVPEATVPELIPRSGGLFGRSRARSPQTSVVLIRPGATVYDEEHRICGCLDLPLSDRGLQEVGQLADQLRRHVLADLYSGPSRCALQTAEGLARVLGLKVRAMAELRNLDHGLWQGLQVSEIQRRCQKLFKRWQETPRSVCPPQGESVDEAIQRIRQTLQAVVKRHRGQTIGLVVAEPLAQMIAWILSPDHDLVFNETRPSGTFEVITVADTLGD